MSAPSPASTTGRRDERRIDPRLRASSIIYAQLGNDNGGIVVNLGTGGVSFQAARKLTEEIGTPLQLKLRGSGLNLVIPGALTWLGPTQKEAGISFNSLPAEHRLEIEKWIARETGGSEPAPAQSPAPKIAAAAPAIPTSAPSPAPFPPLTPPAAVTPPALPADRTVARLSAAIAKAQAAVNQASLGTNPDAATPAAANAQPAAITPAAPPLPSTAVRSAARSASSPVAASGAPPELTATTDAGVELPSNHNALFEQLLRDQQLVGVGSASAAPPASFSDASRQEPSPVEAEESKIAHDSVTPTEAAVVPTIDPVAVKVAPTTPAATPPLQSSDPRGPRYVRRRIGFEEELKRWIPAALLARWSGASRKERIIAGGCAAACVLGLLLLISFAGSGDAKGTSRTGLTASPSKRASDRNAIASTVGAEPSASIASTAPATKPTASSKTADAATPAATSNAAPDSASGSAQSAASSSAASKPDSESSFLAKLSDGLFNFNSEEPKISDAQIRVQVWTSQNSGYYYCTDTDYYKSVQPGTLMQQGDALQDGYRPKLGHFCN